MGVRNKKDDQVVVISGKGKGARGTVLRVLHEVDRVVVEDVNVRKRHTKPTPLDPEGGIKEQPMPIHISNVMLIDPSTDAPTRVRFQTISDDNGKQRKVRIAVKSGTNLDA